MTPEERFTKLEEAMLVNASLLVRLEQRGEGHKEWLEAHKGWLEEHDKGMAELRAAQMKTEQSLQTLVETVDRFIRGRGSNGRKQ